MLKDEAGRTVALPEYYLEPDALQWEIDAFESLGATPAFHDAELKGVCEIKGCGCNMKPYGLQKEFVDNGGFRRRYRCWMICEGCGYGYEF